MYNPDVLLSGVSWPAPPAGAELQEYVLRIARIGFTLGYGAGLADAPTLTVHAPAEVSSHESLLRDIFNTVDVEDGVDVSEKVMELLFHSDLPTGRWMRENSDSARAALDDPPVL